MKNNNLPYGFTNHTERQGKYVIKRYMGPGALQRWQTESTVLTLLREKLPVPEVAASEAAGEIRTGYISGYHAQDLLHEGKSQEILSALGILLKQIQELPIELFSNAVTGRGSVLVHGDFGPQNLLLSADLKVLALTDWEWAHLGNPVEDAAWTEWIIRTHYPGLTPQLSIFFEAYGDTPSWDERYQAMILQCQRYLEFARMLGKKKLIDEWKGRLRNTRRFQGI